MALVDGAILQSGPHAQNASRRYGVKTLRRSKDVANSLHAALQLQRRCVKKIILEAIYFADTDKSVSVFHATTCDLLTSARRALGSLYWSICLTLKQCSCLGATMNLSRSPHGI
jgi:hypothetical protein